LKKKYTLLAKIILIFFISLNFAHAEIKDKLIKKIEDTQTLVFEFKQKIADKIETGNCIVKYPKLIRCDYNDKKYHKRLVSNGKTLAIIQRRYKKIFYYSLKSTPLYFLLDKEYLIEFIKKNEPQVLNNNLIKYEINEKNKKFNIFFDKNSQNLKGWSTEDIYKNNVEFLIINLKTNIPANKKLFKIPSKEKL
jgi:outer membrane lipoprotein-sorting protein